MPLPNAVPRSMEPIKFLDFCYRKKGRADCIKNAGQAKNAVNSGRDGGFRGLVTFGE